MHELAISPDCITLKHCFLSGDDRCFAYCFVLRWLIFSVYESINMTITSIGIEPTCTYDKESLTIMSKISENSYCY